MNTGVTSEWNTQGFPLGAASIPDEQVGRAGWNIHRDFETPFAVIDVESLDGNARRMRSWAAEHGVEWWPHAKTVMSRALVGRQLESGAEGLTVATIAQLRIVRGWGVERCLVANQVVQAGAAAWMAREQREFPPAELWSFIDSPEGVEILQHAAHAAQTTLDVLVEVGAHGARTGVRSREDLIALITSLRRAPGVRVRGVAAYEGSCASDRSPESITAVDDYLNSAMSYLSRLIDAGIVSAEEAVFSAGGSMFFDRVVTTAVRSGLPVRTVVRSGAVHLHDHGLYASASPLEKELRPTLTVWATVHSQPEPGRAYADVGRRDVSFDQGLPFPVRVLRRGADLPEAVDGVRVTSLNDHHAHLEVDDTVSLAVGDRIELGISHPCTTMDKWRRLPLVDREGGVVGAVSTEF